MATQITDAPGANLAFVVGQAYRINPTVYATQYPDLDYGRLVYVDTSSPEWSEGIVTFVSDSFGKANWGTGEAKDVPLAGTTRDRSDVRFHFAHIGYEYNDEEIGRSQLLGVPLTADKALAARRAYTEFMWNVTLTGDTDKNLPGLANQASVTAGIAPADGTGGATTWFDANGNQTKEALKMIRDLNGLLTGIFTGSLTVEMADTILLPYSTWLFLGATVMSPTNSETVLSYLQRNNAYTQQTGRQLTFRGVLGLDTAGAGGTKRIVAYANRQDVTKLHLPAPHRFKTAYQNGAYNYLVPGWFRTGGVEVLRPSAFRYLDGI